MGTQPAHRLPDECGACSALNARQSPAIRCPYIYDPTIAKGDRSRVNPLCAHSCLLVVDSAPRPQLGIAARRLSSLWAFRRAASAFSISIRRTQSPCLVIHLVTTEWRMQCNACMRRLSKLADARALESSDTIAYRPIDSINAPATGKR